MFAYQSDTCLCLQTGVVNGIRQNLGKQFALVSSTVTFRGPELGLPAP